MRPPPLLLLVVAHERCTAWALRNLRMRERRNDPRGGLTRPRSGPTSHRKRPDLGAQMPQGLVCLVGRLAELLRTLHIDKRL
jgi:hypothetical protein